MRTKGGGNSAIDVQPQKNAKPWSYWRENWREALELARAAPRCHATAKHTGERCRNAAAKGWKVCRFHGARGGAPKGNKNRLVHGYYSAAAKAERREVREMIRGMGDLLKSADSY